ncbi:hypothetical protein SAM9427_21855 [Streptomyces sp. ETH9427]|nr:hypothetical protein SAM9427_21855 [Streptomyces sp. ETH9427]
MRDLICWLIGLLFPGRGKHRDEEAPPVPVAPRPAPRVRVPKEAVPLDAEASPMVRPYVIAWERERERRRQRERRTALVLATAGIDYEGLSA